LAVENFDYLFVSKEVFLYKKHLPEEQYLSRPSIDAFLISRKTLFAKNFDYQRDKEADYYHGSNGNVDFHILPVDHYVPRQSAERNFSQPWPEKADKNKRDSYGN